MAATIAADDEFATMTTPRNQGGRCYGITLENKRCKNPCSEGNLFCRVHVRAAAIWSCPQRGGQAPRIERARAAPTVFDELACAEIMTAH